MRPIFFGLFPIFGNGGFQAAVFSAGCWAQSSHTNKGVATSVSGKALPIAMLLSLEFYEQALVKQSCAFLLLELLVKSSPAMRAMKTCDIYLQMNFLVSPNTEGVLKHEVIDAAGVRAGPAGQTPSAGAVILSKETRDDGTIVRASESGLLLVLLINEHAARLWCAFNTASMAVAYASSDAPQPTVCLTPFICRF